MEDELFEEGELEAIFQQRVKDGFGYFMVIVYTPDKPNEEFYSRMIMVKARDAEHAKSVQLRDGEKIESVEIESKEMYDWFAKRPGDSCVDLMVTA